MQTKVWEGGVQLPDSVSRPPGAEAQFGVGYEAQFGVGYYAWIVTVVETDYQRLDCCPELTPSVSDVPQFNLKTSPMTSPRHSTVCHRLASQGIGWPLRFRPHLSQMCSHNPKF